LCHDSTMLLGEVGDATFFFPGYPSTGFHDDERSTVHYDDGSIRFGVNMLRLPIRRAFGQRDAWRPTALLDRGSLETLLSGRLVAPRR
jgi:hypothetical protein